MYLASIKRVTDKDYLTKLRDPDDCVFSDLLESKTELPSKNIHYSGAYNELRLSCVYSGSGVVGIRWFKDTKPVDLNMTRVCAPKLYDK